jgi:hypothetical protein
MEVFIHEVRLTGDSDFTNRFNYVSDLFKVYQDAGTKEEQDAAFNNYWAAKYALETGGYIPTPKD